MIDLINKPHVNGEYYAIERESEADLKHRRSLPALSFKALEAFLARLQERGVCLQWNGRALTLSWAEVNEWPYRDASCWRDVELVRTNFDAIVEYFGLNRAAPASKRRFSSHQSTITPRS